MSQFGFKSALINDFSFSRVKGRIRSKCFLSEGLYSDSAADNFLEKNANDRDFFLVKTPMSDKS